MMRRREFVAGLGSAVAWPVVARAQQQPVIGFLNIGASNDIYYENLLSGFRRGLKEAGYVEGQNVAIEFRWAEGQYERLPTMAADLVRRQVAVISAGGPPSASAAEAATTTIPIVFTVGDDAVNLGLVASLNRPSGNATGVDLMIDEMESKRLGLLHELLPKTAMIAVLLNPYYAGSKTEAADLQIAARSIGRQVVLLNAGSEGEIDSAFSNLVQRGAGGLLVGSDPFFVVRREQLVALAARYQIPTIYNDRYIAARGGLMSYGISVAEGYRQAGNYVGRILKGEKPADLPVVRPTKFELVINLKTAKALGLTIPETLLAIADEVIQ
jgi:putative tryptophan/tyrosine transport system substrate-binding protein